MENTKKKKLFASIYLDGVSVLPTCRYGGEPITLGPGMRNKKIKWVEYNNLLISDRVLCPAVPWTELNKAGLIYGRLFDIEGVVYWCRSLKGNEWAQFQEAIPKEANQWKNNRYSFWGQNEALEWDSDNVVSHGYVVWGPPYSGDKTFFPETMGLEDNGFRPVLERLSPSITASDDMIGSKIRVFGEKGSITGTLADISDYDLVIEAIVDNGLSPYTHWVSINGDSAVIDRSSIQWLQKEEGEGK